MRSWKERGWLEARERSSCLRGLVLEMGDSRGIVGWSFAYKDSAVERTHGWLTFSSGFRDEET